MKLLLKNWEVINKGRIFHLSEISAVEGINYCPYL